MQQKTTEGFYYRQLKKIITKEGKTFHNRPNASGWGQPHFFLIGKFMDFLEKRLLSKNGSVEAPSVSKKTKEIRSAAHFPLKMANSKKEFKFFKKFQIRFIQALPLPWWLWSRSTNSFFDLLFATRNTWMKQQRWRIIFAEKRYCETGFREKFIWTNNIYHFKLQKATIQLIKTL